MFGIKKRIILFILLIMIIISVSFIVIKYFRGKGNSLDDETALLKAALTYFNDADAEETSIWALVENGYYAHLNNKCQIITYKERKFEYGIVDCKKAEEISRIPVIKLETTNDLILNKWNNHKGNFTYILVNGGNSKYSEENITKSVLKNLTTGEETNDFKILEIPYYVYNNEFELIVEFNNGEYVYKKNFSIKIDAAAPLYSRSEFTKDKLQAYYSDISDFKVLYYVSEVNNTPDIYDLKEDFKLNYECGKTYYAWSMAIDEMNNVSDINYAGSYIHQC